MTNKLKKLLKDDDNYLYKTVYEMKVHKFMRKFVGLSYKDNKKVPFKKTTKSHHRLRTTWIG